MSLSWNEIRPRALLAAGLFLILLVSSTRAYSQWAFLYNPSTKSVFYNFISISASDENNCTAAGFCLDSLHPLNAYTTFLTRTKDGGRTWDIQKSDFPHTFNVFQSEYIRKVFALDSLNVVAVGDSGLILRTTDAGTTWHSQHPTDSLNFWDVNMADSMVGVAVGTYGVVSTTTDAGKTWLDHFTPSGYFESVGHAFDAKTFCAINAFNSLDFTHDQGSTWKSSQVVLFRSEDTDQWHREITSAHFFDRNHIVAVGVRDSNGLAALAFATSDGGASWSQTFDSVTGASGEFICIDFADSLFGIGGTRNNYCYITRNGGYDWEVDTIALPSILKEPGNSSLIAIAFASKRSAFAIIQNGTRAYLARYIRPLEDAAPKQVSKDNLRSSPNPFLDFTTIKCTLNERGHVEVSVLNILGKEVVRLYSGNLDAGEHSFVCNASEWPAGCYFAVLRGDRVQHQVRMLLVR